MMDLFRHRSQSAVSADDKRKAVSQIYNRNVITFLNRLNNFNVSIV